MEKVKTFFKSPAGVAVLVFVFGGLYALANAFNCGICTQILDFAKPAELTAEADTVQPVQ